MPVSCHNVRQRASGVRAKQCICSKIVAGPKAWNSLPSELICIAVDSTLGIIWRWSCSLELMAFLLTFSSVFHVVGRGCGLAFWTAPGLTMLHCISARLLVSLF